MKLQNYKIRTNGRNQEILAKAKELGYERPQYGPLNASPFLFLHENTFIGVGDSNLYFENYDYPEISVDDFLLLGKVKPDAYISYGGLITYPHGYSSDLTKAYLYNIISEDDYKLKYNVKKKLQFGGYDITVHNTCIDIGCKTYTKEALRTFVFIADEVDKYIAGDLDAVAFLKNNKEELGL